MVREIVRCEIGDGRGFTRSPLLLDGIFAPHRIGEHGAGLPLGLVEREQRAMLSNGHAPGGPRAPVPVLDNVASGSARLNAKAKAGEGAIPDHEVGSPGHHPLDYSLAKLLLGHAAP